jgi:hypothetical protein
LFHLIQIAEEKLSEATIGYREDKEVANRWARLFATPYFLVSIVSFFLKKNSLQLKMITIFLVSIYLWKMITIFLLCVCAGRGHRRSRSLWNPKKCCRHCSRYYENPSQFFQIAKLHLTFKNYLPFLASANERKKDIGEVTYITGKCWS